MDVIAVLIPGAVALGAMGLLAFLWSLASNQYEDLEGAAQRILIDDEAPAAQPTRGVGSPDASRDPGPG